MFVLNGIASAMPATLVLFFVQDRLQAPAALEPVFLGTYFRGRRRLRCPLWLRLVPRLGLARTWLAGMLLAVAAFAWAAGLAAGDAAAFCRGLRAVGHGAGHRPRAAAALLAGVIAQPGPGTSSDAAHAGAYFGWWNFATKLNLALAAGLALPLLALAGYAPGRATRTRCWPWSLAYCVLPCLLKLLAAAALWLLLLRRGAALAPGLLATRSSAPHRKPCHDHRTPPFPEAPDCSCADAVRAAGRLRRAPAVRLRRRATALSLRDYFNGRVRRHGMFQDRAGKVVKRFTVTMDCRWNGDTGVLDEAFRYSDGSTQRRVWTLRALGDGRFTGTADDVVGTAEGEQRGNAFHWNYTLRQPVGDKTLRRADGRLDVPDRPDK